MAALLSTSPLTPPLSESTALYTSSSAPNRSVHAWASQSMHSHGDKTLPPLSHALRSPIAANASTHHDAQRTSHYPSMQASWPDREPYLRRTSSHSPLDRTTSRPLAPPLSKHTSYDTLDTYSIPRSSPHLQLQPRSLPSAVAPTTDHPDRWPPDMSPGSCKSCIALIPVVQEVVAELTVVDSDSAWAASLESPASRQIPNVTRDGAKTTLQWVIDGMRRMKEAFARQQTSQKRKYDDDGDDIETLKKHRHSTFAYRSSPDDHAKLHFPLEHYSSGHLASPRDASESIAPGPPSPRRDSRIQLPSPSSTQFSSQVSNTSLSLGPTSAQIAHLQELQHQVSTKTLALQTLQREYDSLIQKLQRQRTKCSALERKFQVSDTEINSLTDDKERLLSQVTALESQVAKLQDSRDEARTQSSATNGQYMKIMEMSSRLSAQAATDKRQWAAEKKELLAKITTLEGNVKTNEHGNGTAVTSITSPLPTPSKTANPSSAAQAPLPLTHAGSGVSREHLSDSSKPMGSSMPPPSDSEDRQTAPQICTQTPVQELAQLVHSGLAKVDILPATKTLVDELAAILREGTAIEEIGESLSRRGSDLRSRCDHIASRLLAEQTTHDKSAPSSESNTVKNEST